MTFFFDKSSTIRANWTIRKDSNDISSYVFLGRGLWRDLSLSTENSRVYISLTVAHADAADEDTYVVCQAMVDEEIEEHIVSIPITWAKSHSGMFVTSRSNEVFVQPVLPPTLSSIIVTALSSDAYRQACDDNSTLETSLFDDGMIIRQGDTLTASSAASKSTGEGNIPQYRIEMTEPVSQGFAKRRETKIILLSTLDDSSADAASEASMSEDQDDFEIDEDFLGSTLLQISGSPQLDQTQDTLSGQSNGHTEGHLLKFTAKVLTHSTYIPEDDRTLCMRTTDLGKLGILSGDWAIANSKPSNLRLVKIVANDSIVGTQNMVSGSPLLIHNTFADEVDAFSSHTPLINIRPSPFGSLHPAIPTARSITIARVASPISINRRYQESFVESLKAYFTGTKRLMKQGDLIAITIDTYFSRFIPEDTKTGAPTTAEDAPTFRYPNHDSRPNEVVFFKVTNIEYDIVSRPNSSAQDLYIGSTLGELGCWFDASITRMIQTGVEYSRVPDVRSYMNVVSSDTNALEKLTAQPSSRLLAPQSPYSKVLALTSAALSQKAVDYDLQLSFLLKGGRSIGKFTVTSWVAQRLGLHLFEVNCYDILGDTDTKTEAMMLVRLEQARDCTPCLLVLRHLEALSQSTQAAEPGKEPSIINVLRESFANMQSSWRLTGYPVVVIGTTSESGRVPPTLLSCFKQEINFEAPNEGERLEIINCLLADQQIASDVSLKNLATQTAALLAGDLCDLVARAKTASVDRALTITTDSLSLHQIPLSAADFDVALGKARDSYSESIGAPKIPSVSWDDVGGLAHVKADILDTIQLPLDHPELFADGLKRRSGILLYGPPGTGKTLIAKAVATSCALNFFSVKGPELLNMYIGESEANVRRVFQRARDAKPCVIFFDELDSVAPNRGNHGDSGGVMDRIVSQLLAELDGMSGGGDGGADVFVIGATNRPDLLDSALLRPGRFDRMLYLGVSDNHDAQLNILEALTRKFRLDPRLNLRTVAEKCPFNYTGADFYALCSDAMLNAMSLKAESIEEKIESLNALPGPYAHPHPMTPQYYLAELATPEEIAVYVSESDFERALDMLVPSVSQAEMEHYAEVQKRFSQVKPLED